MEFLVLDETLKSVAVIENFSSAIWTDRYREFGDFELVIPINDDAVPFIRKNYYLYTQDSEHLMIIEDISTDFSIEESTKLIISGRSLESVLDRRIIWGLKTFNTTLQNAVKTILNEVFINPTNSKRKVSNMVFVESTDTRITSLRVEAQFTGDNVYDVIVALCEAFDIGFKMVLNSNNQFEFSLYKGDDRSYDQTTNPYVVFSPKFENLIDANYTESDRELKNVTLIGGEDQGNSRKYATVDSSATGLNRRELFTDARDISSNVEGGTLSAAEYTNLLLQRGREKLSETATTKAFEGRAETTVMFLYGVDFFMGDLVQVDDGYGHDSPALITEIVNSQDADGVSTYPTFQIVNNDE